MLSELVSPVRTKFYVKLWHSLLRHKVADKILFDSFILTRVYACGLFQSAEEYYNLGSKVAMPPQQSFAPKEMYGIMAGIIVHYDMSHPEVNLTMLWSCKDELIQYLKNQISTPTKTLCKAINAYIDNDRNYYLQNTCKMLHNTVQIALSDIPLKVLKSWKYYNVYTVQMQAFSFWRQPFNDEHNIIGTYLTLYKNVSPPNVENYRRNIQYKGLANLMEHCATHNYLTAGAIWLLTQFRMTWDMNDMSWWDEKQSIHRNMKEDDDDIHKCLNRSLIKKAGFNLKNNSLVQTSKDFIHLAQYDQKTTIEYDVERNLNRKIKIEDEKTQHFKGCASPTQKRVQETISKATKQLKLASTPASSEAFQKRKRKI